jgi:hypothetical protein
MNFKNWFTAGFLALSISAGGIAAAKTPDAQITIDETQFKIGGLGVGANIGISKMSASGDVYDLKKIEDFPGNYGRVGGSVAAGKGMGGMTLRNEKGVTLQLKGTTEGLQFDISASGVNIYFPK